MLRMLLSASVLILAASSVCAQEEKKKVEPGNEAPQFKAPPPKALPAPQPMPEPLLIVPYQRIDTRDVWQHYAPNRMGRMVPRVIVTPYGAYYSRTLEPYPWADGNSRAVRPIMVD